jgi:MFS family permease
MADDLPQITKKDLLIQADKSQDGKAIMTEVAKPNAGYYAGITALIALGKFIFGVDFGATNVALATIGRDLHIDPAVLPWVVATYSLTYAGFLVLGGRAADTFGRRRFCILGFALFCAGLVLAMFAANVWMLIAARAVEGFGSALFIPASFSLINVLLPDGPLRHRAFSVFGATQGLAMILGLFGGGILTTTFGWRSVFVISLPLVLGAVVLAWRLIPAHLPSAEKRSVDVGGAVLITAAAVLALTSLSVMGKFGWMSVRGLGLLGGSAVSLAVFLMLERKLRDPLMSPALYSYANFIGSGIASVGAMAATGCCFALLNLFMQRVLHFTAMRSGVGMLPYAFAVIVSGQLLGHSMAKYSLRNAILAGFTVFTVGTLVFATVSADQGYGAALVVGSILAGFGGTFSAMILLALGTASVPVASQGVVTGVLVTFQQIGLALGITVGIAVISAAAKAGDSPVAAFHQGFLAAAAMTAVGLVCTLVLTQNRASDEPDVMLTEPL